MTDCKHYSEDYGRFIGSCESEEHTHNIQEYPGVSCKFAKYPNVKNR